jgi:signal transduction histidine kinase
MNNLLSYEELKARCDDFQAQIIRFLKVEQELINTRSRLDLDLSRFRLIQAYNQKILAAESIDDFATITVESIVETFEVECSALFLYDKQNDCLALKTCFGYEPHADCLLGPGWIDNKGFRKRGRAFIEFPDPKSVPFGQAGLYKVILSPFYNEDEDLHGMLLGGVTVEKKGYYDEITDQLIPSFMVFTQQMGSMLENFESKRFLDEKVKERTKELQKVLEDLKHAQTQLVQSEKMASLGQLVAGIAHEINNPVNFINAGVDSLSANIEDIRKVLEIYYRITPGNVTEKLSEIEELKEKVDYKTAVSEINKLIESIKNGTTRTTEIIRGLRTFSRLDEDILKMADIHEGLDSTLILLHNKYKNRIEIIRDYGKVPQVECYPGQLNQVFMNLLSNAIDAIENTGKIIIKTSINGGTVTISIKDTGHGIPENLKGRIFDPFFTTKSVGKGTGLGLSISHGIIEKHGGAITFYSREGGGTEFIISIPAVQSKQ